MCFSYRIRKLVVFLPEAKSNAKIALIKTKRVVIYHGNKMLTMGIVDRY